MTPVPYEVVGLLGRGGMAVVELAVGPDGRRVARKRLPLTGSVAEMELARQRLRREAQLLARLEHPGIVPLLAVEDDGSEVVLVMPALVGSLADRVRTGGCLKPGEVWRVGRTLLDALAWAHAQGVVHRDIKPANVLFDAAGRPALADFGIARSADVTFGLTAVGALLGTPGFLAPEQARGEPAGPPADVFSLGATLGFALTGGGPYGAGDPVTLALRAARGEVRAEFPGVPAALAAPLRQMLDPDAARRPSAAAVLGGTGRTDPAAARRRVLPPAPIVIPRRPITSPGAKAIAGPVGMAGGGAAYGAGPVGMAGGGAAYGARPVGMAGPAGGAAYGAGPAMALRAGGPAALRAGGPGVAVGATGSVPPPSAMRPPGGLPAPAVDYTVHDRGVEARTAVSGPAVVTGRGRPRGTRAPRTMPAALRAAGRILLGGPVRARTRRRWILVAVLSVTLAGLASWVGTVLAGRNDTAAASGATGGPVCASLPYQPCGQAQPAPHTDGLRCLSGYYDLDGIAANGCEAAPDAADHQSLDAGTPITANLVPTGELDTYPLQVKDSSFFSCGSDLKVTLTGPAGVTDRVAVLKGDKVLGEATSSSGTPATVTVSKPSCLGYADENLTAAVAGVNGTTGTDYTLSRSGGW